ncbi:prephenate dehydrogenase, partial [Pulveribacter sp.]|uniref:prephenate dehydrogenase n=1 Tax=Pulveribacter sp. TaxID=2678893 RepID=UPI0028A25442
QGAKVILTPTERTLTVHLRRAETLWSALGCHVRSMAPETHDAAFAAVSHLPHLLAFAMMGSINSQPQADVLLDMAGPGFRDFTRIAAGDPQLWRDVLRANRAEVLAQSQYFKQALQALEAAMQADTDQPLEDLITLASSTRAHWRMGNGGRPSREG